MQNSRADTPERTITLLPPSPPSPISSDLKYVLEQHGKLVDRSIRLRQNFLMMLIRSVGKVKGSTPLTNHTF